jgi:hypothetical protein
MMIKINGLPLLEHDFEESLKIFFSKKTRRVQAGESYSSHTLTPYEWGDVCGWDASLLGAPMVRNAADIQVLRFLSLFFLVFLFSCFLFLLISLSAHTNTCVCVRAHAHTHTQ